MRFKITINIWFIVALVLFVLYIQKANAQDLPTPIVTKFSPHCYTVTDDALTVYFGYVSNGIEHWIGSGYDVTTQAGDYPDALSITVDLLPAPDLPDVTLGRYIEYQDAAMAAFNGIDATQTIHFDVSILPVCDAPTITPVPTVDTCPAWAVDSATGGKVCLWGLPKAGDWQ